MYAQNPTKVTLTKPIKVLLTTTAIVAAGMGFASDAFAADTISGAVDSVTTGSSSGLISNGGAAVTGAGGGNAVIIMNSVLDTDNIVIVGTQNITNTGQNTQSTIDITHDGAVINVTGGGTLDGTNTGDTINVVSTTGDTTDLTINVTNGTLSNSGGNNTIDLAASGSGVQTTINVDTAAGILTGNVILSGEGDTVSITGDGTQDVAADFSGAGAGSSLTVNLDANTDTITLGAGTGLSGIVDINFDEGVITTDGSITGATTLDIGSGGLTAGLNIATNDDSLTATTITVGANGTLTANGAGASVITGAFNLATGGTLVTDSDTTFVGASSIAGTVTGAFALGAGDLTVGVANGASFSAAVTGDTDNTTDTLNVAAGTGNTVAITGALTNFNDVNITTGELQLDGASSVGQIVINGSTAILDLNNTLTADDQGVTLTQGTLDTGGNAITGDVNINAENGTLTGDLVLGAGGHTITTTGNLTATRTFADAITGGAGSDVFTVNLTDAADTLALSSAVTLIEDVNINAGTVDLNADLSGATTLDVASGASLDIVGATTVTATTTTIAGTLTTDATTAITGDLDLVTTTGNISGAVLLGTGGNTFTVSGTGSETLAAVTGGAGADAFTFTTSGTTTLGGAVTLIEDVNVNAGTVDLNADLTGATTLDIASGAALDIVGATAVGATTTTVTGTLTTTGTAVVTGNVGVDSDTGSISGELQLGTGGHTVTYTGNGTQATVAQITGGTGADSVVLNATGALTTSAVIDLGAGADILTLTQNNFTADHAVSADTINLNGTGTLEANAALTATTINITQGKLQVDATSSGAVVLGATAAGEFEVNVGTFTGGLTTAATGFANIVDLNAGTLVGDVDLSAGSGANTVDLASGFTLTGAVTGGTGGDTFTVDSASTISGAILGGGGADTFALSGGTTFTAGSTIGTIETITTTGASTNLTTGGAITGVDTSLNIGSGSTVTANHAITGAGVLTLDGTLSVESSTDVQFATAAAAGANGVYAVKINSGTAHDASDLTLTGGGLDLSAGTMTVAFDSDAGYVADGTLYTVVDGAAASVLAGTLTQVDTSAVYSVTAALLGTDDIQLTVNRATYASLGTNSAADGVGGALDTLAGSATGDLLTIQTQLDSLDTATAVNNALESLSPGNNLGVTTANVATQAGAFNTVSNRLVALRTASETGIATAADGTKMSAFWMEGFGSAANQDGRKGEDGFDASTFGLTIGADSDSFVKGYNIGAAFSYGRSNVDSDSSNNADTDIDSYQLSTYLSTTYKDYFINALASASRNSYDSKRTVAVGTFTNEAKADYDGSQIGFRGEIGRDYKIKSQQGIVLSPTFGLDYSHVSIDDYTETGAGGANLTVDSDSIDVIEFSTGITAKYAYEVDANTTVKPELRAKLKYNVGDNKASSNATLAGGGAAFTTDGLEMARLGASIGAGFTVETKDVDFTFSYDADLKSDYLSHTGAIRARWAF